MKRLACAAGALAVLVLAAGADETKDLTIKQIMSRLHKGAKAPLGTVKAQLKADPPDWKAVQDSSSQFVLLSAGLGKLDPPKGDKAGFGKLADAYYENSKALEAAAKAEDKAQVSAALGRIGASCKDCHAAHKGK